MYCATGWLKQRYKKQRRMIFQRSEIFEFFFCVCLLQWRLSFDWLNWYIFRISLICSWTSWTLVEAQRIKASNWKAQNITFLLTLLWLTAYTRFFAGSPSWAVFDAPLILVLRTRLFISVITLKHNVVCLLCKLAGVNSCYLPPDLFKNLCFSFWC